MPVTIRWRDRQKGRVCFLDILHDGRRKKVTIGLVTPKEARETAARVERELLENGWGKKVAPSLTLEEFTTQYLTEAKARKAYNTFRVDRHALRAFGRFTGEIRMHSLTEAHFEQFRIERLGCVKPTSVNVMLRHLKTAFGWALRKGYVKTNPAAHVKLNRVPQNTHLRYLNAAEIQRLREAIGADKDLRRVVDFALWTGLRRDELVHAQWSDISFEQMTVTVQNKDGFRTKSGRSRVVPINPQLEVMLAELRAVPHAAQDRLFNVNYWTLGQRFRRAARQAGFDRNVTLHTLRHTFASHLIMAGVDLRSVQSMLGHHDVSVTMIYSHLSPGHLARTVERLAY